MRLVGRIRLLKRAREGFTLAEVLLALALMGLAAVAVGQAVRSSLALLERARKVEQPPLEVALARSELLAAESLEDAEDGGTVRLSEGSDADWEAEIEVTDIPDLFEVVFEVDADGEEIREVMFLFRPEWSSPIDRGPVFEDARRQIQRRLEEVDL